MKAAGHRLHLRLFLEHIEVPVISANVTASEGSAATAQIEIVPTDRALAFYPRTVVHLFILDSEELEYTTPSDDLDHHYKLLFMGELFSYTYAKAGTGSRSIVLQCLDFSNYWDTTYLYQTRYGQGGNFAIGNMANFLTAADNPMLNDIVGGNPAEKILQFMKEAIASPGLTQIPQGSGLGGLLSILEKLGGVANLYRGVNDFATISERRVRLVDQVGADSGTTSAAIFALETFDRFLLQQLGALGDLVSFRDLVNLVNASIYYSVVPMPYGRYVAGNNDPLLTPKGVAGVVTGKTEGVQPAFLLALEGVVSLVRGRGYADVSVGSGHRGKKEQSSFNPETKDSQHEGGTAVDLTCSAISGLGNFPYMSMEALRERSEVYPRTRVLLDAYEKRGESTTLEGLVESGELTPEDKGALDRAATFFVALKESFATGVGSGLYWGGSLSFGSDPVWSICTDEKGVNLGLGRDPAHIQASDGSDPAWFLPPPPPPHPKPEEVHERLISHIFRPDIWFASPPLCNVVFPDDYVSLQYDRQLMREITRLELETSDAIIENDTNAGANPKVTIVRRHYFAPVLTDVDIATNARKVSASQEPAEGEKPLTPADAKAGLVEVGIGSSNLTIFPHEKFSGIIPRVEYVSDLSFQAADKLKDVIAEGSIEGSTDATKDKFELYAARTAAFNFLRYRYAARSMSVGSKLLPRITVGFPALVVNRPQVVNDVAPIHFCGLVTSVAHTVNQQGGSTSFSLAYARPHKPDKQDEFILGIDTTKLQTVKIVNTSVIAGEETDSIQVRAMSQLQALLERTEASDAVRGGRDSAPRNIASFPTGDARLSGLLGPTGRKVLAVEMVRTPPTKVPDLSFDTSPLIPEEVPEAEAAFVTGVTPSFGPLSQLSAPQLSVLEETNPTRTTWFSGAFFHEDDTEAAKAALEDAIRPPWMSEDYRNDNIGAKVYEPLLGCKALVDLVSLTELQEDAAEARAKGEVAPVPLGVSVADAASALVSRYSKLNEKENISGAVYSWQITKRVGARLPEVLGSFHRYVSGPYDKLEGLNLGGALPNSFGNTTETPRPVSAALDPRAERQGVVAAYFAELDVFRGLRG